jgi:hypothetical protein
LRSVQAGRTSAIYPNFFMNHPKIQVESKLDILYIKNHMKEYAASLGQENDNVDNDALEMVFSSSLTYSGLKEFLILLEILLKLMAFRIEKHFEKRMVYLTCLMQVYEPLDENLRKQADELQSKVQDALVELSNSRKLLPQKIDALNQESIQLTTCTTEKGVIELGNCLCNL